MKTIAQSAALALLMTAPASAAVVNGSFENDKLAVNGSGWGVFNSVTGWTTLSGPGIEIQTNPTLPTIDAQDGTHYVELDSRSNSAMRQEITLAAGDYILSFWYAPRVGVPTTDGISYSIAGVNGVISALLANPINGWSLVTAAFTTTGGLLNLDFAAVGTSDSYGGFVDNISIAAVPVPAAGLLLLGALGGFAALRRRKTA